MPIGSVGMGKIISMGKRRKGGRLCVGVVEANLDTIGTRGLNVKVRVNRGSTYGHMAV